MTRDESCSHHRKKAAHLGGFCVACGAAFFELDLDGLVRRLLELVDLAEEGMIDHDLMTVSEHIQTIREILETRTVESGKWVE